MENCLVMKSVLLLASIAICAGNTQANQFDVVKNDEDASSNDVKNFTLETDTANIETHHDSFIGFTAWAQAPIDYEYGDVIIFDGVILNEGSHYQPLTGRFTCPHTGVYFISVSFRRRDLEYTHIDVMKNDERVLRSYDWLSTLVSNTVSNSAIVSCTEDEDIYLEGWNTGSVYGAPGVPYCTFTVFQMFSQTANGVVNLHESFVGFSSWKTEGQSYISGDLITFGGVRYNDGDHYLPQLYRFICPISGLYYITVNYRQEIINIPQYLGVTQNTLTVLHSSHPDALYNTFSNSRLLRCQQNDTLMVRGIGEGSVYGNPSLPYTTFSAMLIYEEVLCTVGGVKHSSLVGFSMFKKYTQNYVTGDTIQFEGELYNDGGYYSLTLNRFQCPVNGIYYFALNLMKSDDEDIGVDLTQETRVTFRLEETLGDAPGSLYNTISNSAVLRCFTGEVIQVKAAGNGTVFGEHDETHTTFTGFLLYQY